MFSSFKQPDLKFCADKSQFHAGKLLARFKGYVKQFSIEKKGKRFPAISLMLNSWLDNLSSKRRRKRRTSECFPMGTPQSWRRHHSKNAKRRGRFNWSPASRVHGRHGPVSLWICWSARVCSPPHVDTESLCDCTKHSTHIPYQSSYNSRTGTREPRHCGSWRRCTDGTKGFVHYDARYNFEVWV